MTSTTGAGIATGTYTIDTAASRIGFTTAHMFGLGPVAGTFAIRSGTVTLADDPAKCTVTARIDAASFTTDKPRRDKDIRSKRFLHAERYPDLVFESDRLVRDGDRWLLHGRLTVHGLTAPVTLEVHSGTAEPDGCRFRARARIDRYAHHVGPRGIVGRYLNAEFDIVGRS